METTESIFRGKSIEWAIPYEPSPDSKSICTRTGKAIELTDQQRFIESMKARIYSRLASDITDQIFGEDGQESGTIDLGDQQISYERVGDEIIMTFVDGDTVTKISFPIQYF